METLQHGLTGLSDTTGVGKSINAEAVIQSLWHSDSQANSLKRLPDCVCSHDSFTDHSTATAAYGRLTIEQDRRGYWEASELTCIMEQLKELLVRTVWTDLDHPNLNVDVPWLDGVIPTTEKLAAAIWGRLDGQLGSGRLACVRLWETERNMVEYRGEMEPGGTDD